ncbi:MAG: cobalamin-dependent protein [Treponema sp.]|jgi:radical SAM superfamily enzyme YgiQ (UPF0313 family)|nr:cobalamin-dependent protein [Treponema sp.]
MIDIVLSTINAKWIHPSLALRLLKANLGEYEDRCEIVEFAPRQSLEEKLAILAGFRPKILGLSVSIWNHKASLELLKELRKTGKNDPCPPAAEHGDCGRPIVVLGGPEVSYLPEESEIIRYADFVIRGEGEKAFAELCNSILGGEKFSGIPSPGAKILGGHVSDPAAIYSAYRLYSDEDLRRKLIYVEASRDCPFSCAFCQSAIKASGSADPAFGTETPRRKTVREFPLGGFLSDMEYLLTRLSSVRSNAAPGSSRPTIKFLDRSFNADIPRALSIMEFFLEKASLVPAGFQLHFEMVPSLFSPELVKTISRFPPETLRLELGIQSFNPEVCAAIGRPSRPEKELETIGILRTQTNAIVHADLIAGLPGEDIFSFAEGFDRLWQALTVTPVITAATTPHAASEVPRFEIQPGILKGLPGTPLRELDEKFGMTYSSEPPYEVIETAALDKADLDRLRNFARFWELIVNRPWKAVSNRAAGLSAEKPALPLVPGKPVFWPFMELSEKLFRLFGRNWGIDREAMRAALPKRYV